MSEIGRIVDEMNDFKKKDAEDRQKKIEERKRSDARRTAEIHEIRSQLASQRDEKNERTELDKCKETARLLQEFKKCSGAFSGQFFDALLDVLQNFQCKL